MKGHIARALRRTGWVVVTGLAITLVLFGGGLIWGLTPWMPVMSSGIEIHTLLPHSILVLLGSLSIVGGLGIVAGVVAAAKEERQATRDTSVIPTKQEKAFNEAASRTLGDALRTVFPFRHR